VKINMRAAERGGAMDFSADLSKTEKPKQTSVIFDPFGTWPPGITVDKPPSE
jgi:hypothetical protein